MIQTLYADVSASCLLLSLSNKIKLQTNKKKIQLFRHSKNIKIIMGLSIIVKENTEGKHLEYGLIKSNNIGWNQNIISFNHIGLGIE